jgi:membrane-associated protein
MIHQIFDYLKSLHNPETFAYWLTAGGVYVITAIIFAETGLLFGFFLPGDSMLITIGVLSNAANPNHIVGLSLGSFMLALTVAAIIGDQLGFYLGRKTGAAVIARPDGMFFKRKYLENAQAFYAKHGVVAVIACRFIPIMRTFVPFVAGMARMPYAKFAAWDIVGGTLWINTLLLAGYFLGQTGLANRLDKVIVIVIFVSILPMIIGALKQFLKQSKDKNGEKNA